MKQPHVAFVSYPQHPHVGPILPIVSVLVRRGYRVSCVVSDVFAARVAQLGAQPVICERDPTYMDAMQATHETKVSNVPVQAAYPNIPIQLAHSMLELVTRTFEAD